MQWFSKIQLHWPGYYISIKDEFAKNFLSLKIKTVGMDMKRGGYPLRIFWKIIYKLDNTRDPKIKVTMIEAEKFESPSPIWKDSKDKIQSTRHKNWQVLDSKLC